jgi:MYXO-CTERM domain-containing protein
MRALAAFLAAWALTGSASAHDPPHGRALLWESAEADALPTMIVANRGIVFADAVEGGQVTYSLRCYQAYGGGITEPPGVFASEPGSLTIGVFSAVSATSDRACSFQPSSGLPADVESLSVAVQDVEAPNRLFVASRTFSTRAALFVSEDYGQTWSERFENPVDDYFHALFPTPADPQRLYAAGRRVDRTNQKLIFFSSVSLDAGLTWQDHALATKIIPFAVHPHDADVLFAYEPLDVKETVYRVLRSGDRGATFEPVIEGLPLPTSVAADDASSVWLGIGGEGGLYRSTDGGRSFEPVLEDSVQSVSCLVSRQSRLWMCANMAPNTDGIWFSDDQGATFEKWMVFADVTQPVMCTDDAAQAVCASSWYDFDTDLHPTPRDAGIEAGVDTDADAPDGDVEPEDAGVPDDGQAADAMVPSRSKKPSSGCQAAPAGAAAPWGACFAGLALLVMLRRRRTKF